jgi:hypothetical protein
LLAFLHCLQLHIQLEVSYAPVRSSNSARAIDVILGGDGW